MPGEVEMPMIMPDRPILSIIIPTKNRAKYVVPCVLSLMKISATDIEIVVQDNSDNDQTDFGIASLTMDARLRYNRCADQLSMSDNFTKGLEVALGEYIAFLGDDDGVNPEVVEAVRWAKAEGLDALVGCEAAAYFWPDVIFTIYGRRFSGNMYIKPFSAVVTYPDPMAEMQRCVRTGGSNFGRLPKAYQGVVRRESLERIWQKTGTYFPGPTPDMASAMALANCVNRYAYVDYPLFIPGIGRGSAGGAGTEKKHDWSIESVPWFSPRAINLWSDIVPRYCGGTTLWGEGVIQALQAMGREDVLQHFNAVFLYARCAVFNRRHNQQTFATFRHFVSCRRLNRFWAVAAFAYYYLWTWAQRLWALFSNATMLTGLSRTRRISNMADIDQAVATLTQFLRARGRHFDERLS
jgi:glycosyltransferase involved in cell wall biosynthesis